MSKQPEALRLADELDNGFCDTWLLKGGANELRRLHQVNAELLEALKLALKQNECDMVMTGEECRKASKAIAKATGESDE